MVMPLTSRKTNADSRPARVLPSTNGWLLTMWNRYAAAIENSPSCAYCSPNEACGCATADSRNPPVSEASPPGQTPRAVRRGVR
jgi:hypothetical protein